MYVDGFILKSSAGGENRGNNWVDIRTPGHPPQSRTPISREWKQSAPFSLLFFTRGMLRSYCRARRSPLPLQTVFSKPYPCPKTFYVSVLAVCKRNNSHKGETAFAIIVIFDSSISSQDLPWSSDQDTGAASSSRNEYDPQVPRLVALSRYRPRRSWWCLLFVNCEK